jgi:hypothetical protein
MTRASSQGRLAGLVVKGLHNNKGDGVMPFPDALNNVKAVAEAGKVREDFCAHTTLAAQSRNTEEDDEVVSHPVTC